MKKFVLVLVCVLILVIFIAFNYLLWEKENRDKDIENLKYINISSNSRINAYERDIKGLEGQIKLLEEKLTELEKGNKLLEEDKLQLEKKNTDYVRLVEHKNMVIDMLKGIVNIKDLEVPVRKWTEAVDAGKYEDAYNLLGKNILEQEGFRKFNDFAEKFKNSVKTVRIKDINLVTEGVAEGKEGDIIFKVVLEVDVTESESKANEFKKGSNERFFTVDFDDQRGSWLISDISDSL